MNVRTRLKVFLFFTALAVSCVKIQAHDSHFSATESKLTLAQQNAKKAKDKTKAELIAYYGLTGSEVDKLLEMRERKKAKIRAVKQSTLSKKESNRKRKIIVDAFKKQLKVFFTPEQYALYEARINACKQNMAKVKAEKKSYKVEKAKIKSLPKEKRKAAKEALKEKYVSKIAQYMKQRKAEKKILAHGYSKYTLNKGGNKLKISFLQRFKMAKILKQKQKRLAKLRANNDISRKDRKKQKSRINMKIDQRLQKLIGHENFVKYLAFKDKAHARKFKKQFGFSKKEYLKYIDIENTLAIEKMDIRKSAIPKAEKKKRKEAAQNRKIESLRKSLSDKTFKKWHAAYIEKKTSKKTNNAV